MRVGYIWIQKDEENIPSRDALIRELDVEKVFIDKCNSRIANRPKLAEMLNFIREGDTVIVSEIRRFARNTRDLLNMIDLFTKMGIQFESRKEKIDTSTPSGQFLVTVLAEISLLEKDYILSRQRVGIEAKKARGEYRGRIPISVDQSQFEQEYKLWKSGQISATTAMAHLGLKPNTFYRRVKEYEGANNVETESKE